MTSALIILSLLVLAGLLVVAVDLIPQFLTWLQRIHIGRVHDREKWIEKITPVVRQWLLQGPTIPVTDNERLIVLDMIKCRHKSSTIQSWQEAALLLGAGTHLRQHPNDVDMQQAVNAWLKNAFNQMGQWKKPPQQADGALLAYAVMKLPGTDLTMYRPALDHVRSLLFSKIGRDKILPYRDFQPDIRYVDTIGLACPFLAAYGRAFQDAECMTLAFRQIDSYSEIAMLPDWFIPAHAFDIKQKTPLGIYGWGRGIGWYALGLMETLQEMPVKDARRSKLTAYAEQLAQSLIRLQRPDGGWSAMSFLGLQSRLDSSATTLLGLFLFRCFKEFNAPEFLLGAQKCVTCLMRVTRRNGIIDFSQGDTKGIGHYSTRYDLMPFTQGLAVELAVTAISLDRTKVTS